MDIRNNILAFMVDRKLVVRYFHLGGLALFWAAAAVVVAYAHAISDELYRGPACSTLILIIFEVGVWLYYIFLSTAGVDLTVSQKVAVVAFAISPLVSVPFACRWPGSIWAYMSAPAVQ